jgi:hypothetical protein
MEQIVGFFRANEQWVYGALGIFAFWHILKFAAAWNTLRSASFTMERELAQNKLNRAAIMLVLALLVAVAEFTLVSFVAPTMPGANPIPSPTLNILAIPTATLAPEQTGQAPPVEVTPTEEVNPTAGCIADQVMISAPKDGDEVSGVIEVRGTANIQDFGFYKYEIARPGETIWLSINAGEQTVQDGVLGEWITSVLPPGDYQLRLMVADNQGKFKLPCTVQVRVIAPTPVP